ncbi:MAG TPA: TonB-dependent receptor [Bryobacteraceae bacterium]|jgi:iron complex outermembrane receptor protein
MLRSRQSPLKKWALLLLPLLFPVLSAGGAQQTSSTETPPALLKDLSLEQLSQIEVTSPSKEPTPAFKSPVAIYVITGEDIRRSGVTTIPEALRLAPGVEVARIDGSKWSVGVRGFGTRLSRSVLVLIDGRTVYTTLFAGTYWEVQDTLLEDIERIEVIRGPGGVIWGPNAVDGVINIITKDAKDTQGTFASAGGGNVEQGFFNYRYGGNNGKGLSYRVYGKGFTRGPEEYPNGDNFDDWRGVQSGFRMDWTRDARDAFTVQGDLYKQEDGERVDLATYTPPTQRTLDGDASLSGGNVLARWTRRLGDGKDFQLQAYYDRTNRYEPNLGENRDTFDVDFLARTSAPARQQISYGFGARSSEGGFIEAGSGLVFSPAHRADYLFSGFLQDEIGLVDGKVSLTLGSKLLRTNYTGFEFQPSVRLLWTPTEKHSLWASFTHAVRTPSDGEEDFYLSSFIGTSGGLPEFARFNANPNFAPEQLNGYEAGYRTLIAQNLYVDFTAFYNRYHDLFSEDLAGPLSIQTTLPFPEASPPPTYVLISAQFRNDLFGTTKGVEIAPEWRPTAFWRLRASYSFLNMNLHKAPGTFDIGSIPGIVGASPRHEAGVDSSFDISKRLQADLIYRYVSALPAQGVPAYSTGDARIAWRFGSHFEISAVGQNLLQPFHVEYISDPGGPVAIRRSAYVGLAWRTK